MVLENSFNEIQNEYTYQWNQKKNCPSGKCEFVHIAVYALILVK